MTRVAIVLKAVRWLNKLPRREPSMVSFIQGIWSTMSSWLKYGSQQFVGGIVNPCVSPMFYIEYIISMYIYIYVYTCTEGSHGFTVYIPWHFRNGKLQKSAGGYGYEAPFADDVDLDTYFNYVNGGSWIPSWNVWDPDFGKATRPCFLDWEWLGVVSNWKALEDTRWNWMVR